MVNSRNTRLIDKVILLISPEPWSHIFVSKHHYARKLAERGNQVFFLNPPSDQYEVSDTDLVNLKTLDYTGFTSGLRYMPGIVRKWITKKVYSRLMNATGTAFDVVWSFDNSVFFDFDALPEEVLKISHIVDLNQDFQLDRAASSADICFCVTNGILHKLKNANKKSFFINHGYNHTIKEIEKIQLPGDNKLKAIYLGNLAMPHLDWQIVNQAAGRLKSLDFVLIGPGKELVDEQMDPQHIWKKELFEKENVLWLDRIRSSQIMSHLQAADILLIAYQEKYREEQANSHKLLEYLGSGKTIVATFTSQYADYAHLINMEHQNDKWVDLLAKLVANDNLRTDPKLNEQRIELALANTYDEQINKIEALLNENVARR